MKEKESNSTSVVLCVVFSIIALGIGGFIAVKTLTSGSSNNTDYSEETSEEVEKNKKEIEKHIAEYDSSKLIDGNDLNGNLADHVRGKVDSKVIVTEYADLQCPGCASLMPQMHNLYATYGDRVAFVFRNFPISSHKLSRPAAIAAEAAGFQGKYWEMLESLYANRADWLNETDKNKLTNYFVTLFKEIASEGDAAKFRKDLRDNNIVKKLDFDYALGSTVDKVNATPAVFVNGAAVDIGEAKTVGEFGQMIEDAIKAALE